MNPLPPLCPTPSGYFDGNMTLAVDIFGLWSDSNVDGNNLGGDEELVMKWSAKHNLQANFPPLTVFTATQPDPPFNTLSNSGNPTSVINATFSPGMAESASSFSFKAYAFEDDIGDPTEYDGDSVYYDPFDLIYDTDDNLAQCGGNLTPCEFNIDFRSSPPNTDHFIDFPLKSSGTKYGNWTVRLRYQWTINPPNRYPFNRSGLRFVKMILIRYRCKPMVQPTINGEFLTLPIADKPLHGQIFQEHIVPLYDVPTNYTGTKAYRCMIMNRTGSGLNGSNGSPMNVVYSNCVTVTRNPDSPVISSPCNQTLTQGARGIFSFGKSSRNLYVVGFGSQRSDFLRSRN